MFDPESEGMINLKDLKEDVPAEQVEKEYRRLFDNRYRTKCFLGPTDKEAFKWLVSTFGKPKAFALLETFFKMNDQYFRDRAHGTAVLRKCINSVLAKLPSEEPKEKKSRTMLLALRVHCVRCNVEFVWQGPANEIEAKKFCKGCKQ